MWFKGDEMQELKNIRLEIDAIDDELVRLLQRRMDIVDRVAKVKRERGLPVFDAKRESEILDRVSMIVGEGHKAEVREVFSALFAASRSRQLRMT